MEKRASTPKSISFVSLALSAGEQEQARSEVS
jgi:hypothetical protein